mmetsp:Transcript_31554/g.106264  ORF Transcript_31554/g.106264 Transcript_31554/m.106264 type:complete len:299 (+) Transcript_31554:919-1815(+)
MGSRQKSTKCLQTCESTAESGSSKSTTAADRQYVTRASAMRAFWPPLRLMPRSPISHSTPPGSCLMSSARAQLWTTESKRSWSNSSPNVMLSRSVALMTHGTCVASAAVPGRRASVPPTLSTSPRMAESSDDLPLPTGPTTPTRSPARMVSVTLSSVTRITRCGASTSSSSFSSDLDCADFADCFVGCRTATPGASAPGNFFVREKNEFVDLREKNDGRLPAVKAAYVCTVSTGDGASSSSLPIWRASGAFTSSAGSQANDAASSRATIPPKSQSRVSTSTLSSAQFKKFVMRLHETR